METTIDQGKEVKSDTGVHEYREAVKKLIETEVKNVIEELLDEQRKAIRQMVEEHRTAIREAVEEEKKAIWARVEELKKSMLKLGL